MEFFDKKEEVLEIKLTPYGTYKLSAGNFTPEYYSFFDSDILYDSEYAASGGFTEIQNDTQNRISLNTPSMKPLKMNSGISSSQSPIDQTIREAILVSPSAYSQLAPPLYIVPANLYNTYTLAYPSDNFLQSPLGTSKLTTKYLPSWGVEMLQGRISSSALVYTGSLTAAGVTASIPQINITYDCDYYVSKIEGYSGEEEDFVLTEPTDTNNLQAISTDIYVDGTYITVDRRDLILSLTENNADFFKENFDIQVYYSADDSTTWNQLFINNNLDVIYGPTDVEYFLTLNSDREIDTSLINQLRINNDIVFNSSVVGSAGISTREYFIRDLYNPEEEICE